MTLAAVALIPVGGACIIILLNYAYKAHEQYCAFCPMAMHRVRRDFLMEEGITLRKWICALLLVGLLAASLGALAAAKMTEATMIYEDYDGNRCEQTVVDDATLQELQDMLLRTKKNSAELENCTMNSTLFCRFGEDKVYDFAIATDGCPYMTDNGAGKTYRFSDADRERLWEIFDLVQDTMGYDASMVF